MEFINQFVNHQGLHTQVSLLQPHRRDSSVVGNRICSRMCLCVNVCTRRCVHDTCGLKWDCVVYSLYTLLGHRYRGPCQLAVVLSNLVNLEHLRTAS